MTLSSCRRSSCPAQIVSSVVSPAPKSFQTRTGLSRQGQLTLEQEVVLDTVAAVNAELSRSLFRGKDFEVCAEAGDPNDALAGLVGT